MKEIKFLITRKTNKLGFGSQLYYDKPNKIDYRIIG